MFWLESFNAPYILSQLEWSTHINPPDDSTYTVYVSPRWSNRHPGNGGRCFEKSLFFDSKRHCFQYFLWFITKYYPFKLAQLAPVGSRFLIIHDFSSMISSTQWTRNGRAGSSAQRKGSKHARSVRKDSICHWEVVGWAEFPQAKSC